TQVVFCLFFVDARFDDAFERVGERLPIWSVRHAPPPPPPTRYCRRGASRTAVVYVSGDGLQTRPRGYPSLGPRRPRKQAVVLAVYTARLRQSRCPNRS